MEKALRPLQANVSLTAWDSEVIKTYVRLGMGVGIVSEVAMEPKTDRDLVYLDASALFPLSTTWVGFARGTLSTVDSDRFRGVRLKVTGRSHKQL
jgi:DNA-binding transcriptional LysR family regulator